MIYVFVYVGEVGYELLNWQGVVRKFSRTIKLLSVVDPASNRGTNLLISILIYRLSNYIIIA